MLLGLVTTVTHTAVVLILALVLWMSFGDQVPPGLDKIIGLIGGIMVAGLGLWLLTRRLAGRADHVHFGHSHGHGDGDHGHSHGDAFHDHGDATGKIGLGPLIWLGIAGGILPCADAIGLLLLALKEGVPWLGPPLILAFSFGLASVLIGIGIGVVFTRRQIDARSGESARLRKLVQMLPIFSAVAVTVLGLWMCYDSVHTR
jgi:ABC-type nickel/cobalt efflux system permease component RcnA